MESTNSTIKDKYKKIIENSVEKYNQYTISPRKQEKGFNIRDIINLTIYIAGVYENPKGGYAVVIYNEDGLKLDGFYGDEKHSNEAKINVVVVYEALLYLNEYFDRWSANVYCNNKLIYDTLKNIISVHKNGKWTINYDNSHLGKWIKSAWKEKIENKEVWKKVASELIKGLENGSTFNISLENNQNFDDVKRLAIIAINST